jgi:ARG/rhodanese/phosphatase superfamily protein
MKILNNFIENLYTGEQIAVDGLRLTPLFVKEEGRLPYLELEEALRQNLVEITEVSEQGSVPNLQVTNKSLSDILILDGEELLGAKQNRVVNTTIVVPAHSSVVTPVSCVEQGRWRYTSKEFSTGDSFSYPSLRRQKHRDVTSSLRATGSFASDQSRIWDDISQKAARMDVTSDTMAMSDIFESRTESQEHLQHEVPYQEKQVGFFAFIKDGFAGGDVFGSSDLCRKKLPKLVRSYYLDSLDEGVQFPAITVEQILKQIQAAEPEQFASIGKGTEVRFESKDVQGSCKVVDEFIPHLMVFPKN